MDQPSARARRHGAFSELHDARRAAQPRRSPRHALVQRHSFAAQLLGLRRQVQLSGARGRAPSLLMAASGFAGLGYQIVWTQQASLWLGHESAAVLAVVAAFFGGLAVGALGLGSRVEKSSQPARWYAGSELVIALWS